MELRSKRKQRKAQRTETPAGRSVLSYRFLAPEGAPETTSLKQNNAAMGCVIVLSGWGRTRVDGDSESGPAFQTLLLYPAVGLAYLSLGAQRFDCHGQGGSDFLAVHSRLERRVVGELEQHIVKAG